jgi:DNA-binding SARP family transcriptional activator
MDKTQLHDGTQEWSAAALAKPYAFRLLGRFGARRADATWPQLESRKMQEMVSYLLLFRDRAHQRELLASTLWQNSTTLQSKKYLRQCLWQLGRGSTNREYKAGALITADADWLEVNRRSVWLDVAEVEEAYQRVRATSGEKMTEEDAFVLKKAVALYRGELLAGWYEEWCTFERERLKVLYLALLEKLIGYCESHSSPEEGLMYGDLLLRHERAHERAHWRMMRLHYLAGDRTGALRQFEKCTQALSEELGVTPGSRILGLYQEIRADALTIPLPATLPERTR